MSQRTSPRVAVVSSFRTELRPAWDDLQHVDLISEAVNQALKGSGLRIQDVDFVIDSGSDILDGRSISNCGFLGAMGAHQKEESRVEEDGLWAALYGATKIAGSGAGVGLIVAYSKPSESDVEAFYWTQCEPFYQRPVGFGHTAASGLQAQQYLARHSLAPEALREVGRWNRARADANASVRTDLMEELAQLEASEDPAPPLGAADFSRPVDGAVAVVLASEQIARRISADPVWITGMGTACDQHNFAMRDPGALPACRHAAQSALRRAGIEDPTSVSLVETGAGTTAGELMVLEALGLAADGQASALYADDAPVAVNPSGGSLPADPIMATGLVRLCEASLQLAGRVPYAPPGAASAIVHGAGGIAMQNHCVLTLEV